MDIAKIVSELGVFARWPRAFTFAELLDFTDPGIDPELLQQALLGDSRFICLRSRSPDEDRFILDSTLFRWFSKLNIRLAQARQFSLRERQVAHAMSHLRGDGRWDIPPAGAIGWGRALGLVGPSHTPGRFVFPLARMLSFLSHASLRAATEVLEDFGEKEVWKIALKELLQDSVQEGFSQFSLRVVDVVQTREGLLTGRQMTLEQIGASLGLTRERIRQLASRFWNRLTTGRRRYRRPFLVALLCDLMNESGSLIVTAGSSQASLRKFLAKCAGIPRVEVSQIGLLVLGASSKDFAWLKSSKWSPDKMDADSIAKRLEAKGRLSLIDSDVKALAERVAQFRRKRLRASERVCWALRSIGRPAHYSKVAEVHNSLFPDRVATERSIHAILLREEHGVVWIGRRGTFALKEWGYERPSKSLFDRVREIVGRIHEDTGKPVALSVIMAEIGRYRRLVNPNSVAIAAHCNPDLRRVYKDCFVPRGSNDQAQDEISAEELDRVLREFQERG